MALVSVAQLADRIDDPNLRVVDVRWYLNRPGAGREAYDEGHIPGAVFLDLDADLADENGYGAPGRHPLPTPQAFAATLAKAGVGTEHEVVAYDDAGGANAARLWWMLDNLGHAKVAVLDGGIQAWTAAGQPVSTETPRNAPAKLELANTWHSVIDRAELADRLGSVAVLDARAPERYRGEIEPIDPIAGHIPTAQCFAATGNLDAAGHFRPAAELRERFADLAQSETPVVTTCGSGVTACHNALAMRLAGLPDPILYVGSYSDWSRSGMPIATGEEPGDRTEHADASDIGKTGTTRA